MFVVWLVNKCAAADIYVGNGEENINYCDVDNSDPTVSKTIYVSATATTSSTTCTSDNSPCTTINNAVSKASSSGWNKVILMGTAETVHQNDNAEIAVATKQVWITAQSADVVWIPKPTSGSVIGYDIFTPTTGSLRLKGFQIILNNSLSTDTQLCLIFANDKATVYLQDMKIYGKDTGIQTGYSLIDARRNGSKLTITHSEISNITLVNTNYPLIFSSSDKGVGDITVTNTIFTNIIHTDYNGSVFSFNSYEKAICLGNLTFISCSANRGGAIYSEYKDMQLSSCSFVNCTAQNGGAIYWSPSTTPSSTKVVFSELTFCNNQAEGGNGHDIYVSGYQAGKGCFEGCVSYTQKSSTLYNNGGTTTYIDIKNEDCPCDIDNSGRSCLDDIDDVIVDEECVNGGDPLYIHGVIVVFVTDVFGNCLSGQAPLS